MTKRTTFRGNLRPPPPELVHRANEGSESKNDAKTKLPYLIHLLHLDTLADNQLTDANHLLVTVLHETNSCLTLSVSPANSLSVRGVGLVTAKQFHTAYTTDHNKKWS